MPTDTLTREDIFSYIKERLSTKYLIELDGSTSILEIWLVESETWRTGRKFEDTLYQIKTAFGSPKRLLRVVRPLVYLRYTANTLAVYFYGHRAESEISYGFWTILAANLGISVVYKTVSERTTQLREEK